MLGTTTLTKTEVAKLLEEMVDEFPGSRNLVIKTKVRYGFSVMSNSFGHWMKRGSSQITCHSNLMPFEVSREHLPFDPLQLQSLRI